MDDSKGKLIAAAGALLLLVILTPLFIISLAAEDEQKKSALVSCGASVDGEQMVVPPEYQDAINAAAKTANLPPAIIAAQLWTCLLYTSPSPRDATLSRMPSSA